MENLYLSVFLPVFNEEKSLMPLYQKIRAALERLALSFEIIFVDDGSTDGSFEILQRIAERDWRVKVLRLSRNAEPRVLAFRSPAISKH